MSNTELMIFPRKLALPPLFPILIEIAQLPMQLPMPDLDIIHGTSISFTPVLSNNSLSLIAPTLALATIICHLDSYDSHLNDLLESLSSFHPILYIVSKETFLIQI